MSDERTEPTSTQETEAAVPVPEIPVSETPEFRQAVQEAVAGLLPQIVAQFQSATGGQPATGADKEWMQGLAMAISQLTDQGTGRKRVAPEIIEQREKARERMLDLLVSARAEGRVASYELRNKVYLDEVLVDPIYMGPDKAPHPTQIDWPGVPNEAMVPINDTARDIHAAFIESIGSVVKLEGISDEKLGVTPGGLVVKGGAVQQRRELGNMGPQPDPQAEGLRLRHKDNAPGNHKTIRVLGTVAAPARVGVA